MRIVYHGNQFFYEEDPRYRTRKTGRTGLKIYDMFPELERDGWKNDGSMRVKNEYLFDARIQPNEGMYADRMQGWDKDKWKAAAEKNLPRGLYAATPGEINGLINDYLGYEVQLTQIIKMQDTGGFDYWYYAFIDPTVKRKRK